MNVQATLCLTMPFLTGIALGQPKVNAVLNNYSSVLPGMPNYGIAPGAIFHLYGTGMGPSETPTLPDLSKESLNTSLKGVTVKVTVNGATSLAPLYYVSSREIAGILPSSTLTGSGSMTVSYNNETSSTAILVVPSAFGLLNMIGNSGPARVHNASNGNAFVDLTAAANPGDTLVLWGSGLGASPGDESKFPFPQTDLKENVKVYIAGQQAVISYAGRSQFPGLDQINVIVPAAAAGCNVGIFVQSGNYVSNSGTMAVAISGCTCSDPVIHGSSGSNLQILMNKPAVRYGIFAVSASEGPAHNYFGDLIPNETTNRHWVLAEFAVQDGSRLSSPSNWFDTSFSFQQPSLGNCAVFQVRGVAQRSPRVQPLASLDAGTITMELSNGRRMNLPRESEGLYYYYGWDSPLFPINPLFLPPAGELLRLTNSNGGNVGIISDAHVTLPPLVKWTNSKDIDLIERAIGVTVTWDTVKPYAGFVKISGTSSVTIDNDRNDSLVAGFNCTAPYSSGSFEVKPHVLLALPPESRSIDEASFWSAPVFGISLHPPVVQFSTQLLDYAEIDVFSSTWKQLTFK